MSNIDPTLLPPAWQDGQYDDEQHKVMTEHGILDFLSGAVAEEVDRFRQFEEYADLPAEVREFRETLQRQEKHFVNVRDFSLPAKWEAVEVAVNTPAEVNSSKCIFHGIAGVLAANVSVLDQVSGQASTGNPIGLWSVGPNTPPIWFERGISLRRGLWISSSVATTISVYWREWDED